MLIVLPDQFVMGYLFSMMEQKMQVCIGYLFLEKESDCFSKQSLAGIDLPSLLMQNKKSNYVGPLFGQKDLAGLP